MTAHFGQTKKNYGLRTVFGMSIFIGSGVALCTPFNEALEFCHETYENLISFHAEAGTDAIVSCGTTGEAATLSEDEHVEVVKTAAQAAAKYGQKRGRRLPVIAGAGGNDTAKCRKMGKALMRAGADALMYTAPYYNKTSQAGLVAHYTSIAAAVDLPVMVYNVPSRTGINIAPKTVEQLAKIPNIAAIKEASADIGQIAEVAERAGGNIDIYCGNDDHVVPVLSLGGKGVVSTVANIVPGEVHAMVAKYLAGEHGLALKIQLDILPLVRLIFADVNPMPVKAALGLMGLCAGQCRLPLASVNESVLSELEALMRERGMLH